jgi:hypothetical protein
MWCSIHKVVDMVGIAERTGTMRASVQRRGWAERWKAGEVCDMPPTRELVTKRDAFVGAGGGTKSPYFRLMPTPSDWSAQPPLRQTTILHSYLELDGCSPSCSICLPFKVLIPKSISILLHWSITSAIEQAAAKAGNRC